MSTILSPSDELIQAPSSDPSPTPGSDPWFQIYHRVTDTVVLEGAVYNKPGAALCGDVGVFSRTRSALGGPGGSNRRVVEVICAKCFVIWQGRNA